jgi:DNA polymerase IV
VTNSRRILLLDCDMFFVQVARLSDPGGAGRASLLIVGGSGEGRGVVTSADYEVRKFGVRSGMPTARALRLCPDATVVGVPRKACVERSRRIRELLRTLVPVVQAASIDEFYLDLTGTDRLFRDESPEETAHRIRERILAETEISVSIGGGPNRLVAKLAVERAKPGGVHIVPAGAEGDFLREFDLARIPGVGPRFLESLERRGLRTVDDALRVEREWLVRWFGEARGTWLHERIRGIDPTPVVPDEERKSISSERTFSTDLTDPREMERHLLQLSLSVGRTLREKGLRGRTISVKVRDMDFNTRQSSRTVAQGVESDRFLFETARDLVAELRRAHPEPVRLLGVGISNLEEGDAPRQLELFGEEGPLESERDRALSRVKDRVRERFGSDLLVPGRALESGDDDDTPSPEGKP